MDNNKTHQEATGAVASPILIPYEQKDKKYVLCDMCGHANPEYTAQCEMCSNYLTRS